MLRLSTYTSTYAASRKIKEGDVKGEGRILGGMAYWFCIGVEYFVSVYGLGTFSSAIIYITGVFVIGPGAQGIVYEKRNMDFGDTVNTTKVLEAVQSIKPSSESAKL